jgi:DNA-binding XRE family transcriptional regulator
MRRMSKLREYRTAHGLTQTEMAEAVGVKKATISRIENGERTPSMSLVSRICEATRGELTANDFMVVSEEVTAA